MVVEVEEAVIAVFTKYDQFKREIKIRLEDQDLDPETHLDAEVESLFSRHYLAGLTGSPPYIRLESEVINKPRACTVLISLPKECTNPVKGVMGLSR
jgi:hypothetical protein